MSLPRSEVHSLLQAAKREPRDDTPRLILADWLEEHDDPRGAFVRLQCLAAQLPAHDPRCLDLNARAEQLRQTHDADWLGELFDQGERTYERGLLRLTMSKFRFASSPVQALVGSETWAWVEALHLVGGMHGKFARFVDSPLIASLGVLDLSSNSIGPRQAGELARIEHLAGLSTLLLNDNILMLPGALWLAQSPYLGTLTTLGLAGNRIGDDGLKALLNAPALARVRVLDLDSCALTLEGMRLLGWSLLLPQLTSLNLRYNDLGAAGVKALCQAHAAQLEQLDLFGTHCDNEGVAALTSSELVASLRLLDLSRNRLTAPAMQALAGCPRLQHLHELRLFGNQIGEVGLRALLAAPGITRVRRLDLGHNLLGPGSPLFDLKRLRLEALDLGYNPIGDGGLEMLYSTGALEHVRELGLNACNLSAEGTTTLVETAWPALRSLDLRNNPKPRGPAVARLRERLGDGLQL